MKVKVIFFCFLYAQATASFFDEFRDTLLSVEDSFGKLVSDVVTDVRETLDCTILAVKQVLELGDFKETADYNARCKGQTEASDSSKVETTDENYSPMPPLLTATPTPFVATPPIQKDPSEKLLSQKVSKEVHDHVSLSLSTASLSNGEKSLTENVSKEIDKSVVNLEHKMMDVIESHDTRKTVEEVRNRINTETKRLSEIGVLLHRELNNLTQDVKGVLHTMQSDHIHPSLTNIWRDVKVLHDIEINHTNAQDAAEIRHILKEILSVLHVNSDQNSLLLTEFNDKDSNKTFSIIENAFETMKREEEWKSKENETVADDLFRKNAFIKNEFEKIKQEEKRKSLQNEKVVENLFRENSFIKNEFEAIKQEDERKSKENDRVVDILFRENSFIKNEFEAIKQEEERKSKQNEKVMENLLRENSFIKNEFEAIKQEEERKSKQNEKVVENSFIKNEFETIQQEEERKSKQNEYVAEDLFSDNSFMEDEFETIKEEEEGKSKEKETVVDNLFREYVENTEQTTDKDENRTGVFPLTFKDVTKKIIEETRNTYRPADGTVQKYEAIKQTTPKVVPAPTKVRVVENIDSTNYFLSQLVPTDPESREAAKVESLDIIKNSELTNQIMDGFFERSDNLGTDVF